LPASACRALEPPTASAAMARVSMRMVVLCLIVLVVNAHADGTSPQPSIRGSNSSGAAAFVAAAPDPAEAAPEQSGSDGGAAAEGEVLRPMASATGKPINCVCRAGLGNLKCAGVYFSLMHCGPSCPGACRRMGLTFDSCVGKRQVEWYSRLGYRYGSC